MRKFIGEPFERLGGAMIDPDMVVPAALPLDLCGESVRARLCMFADHNNQDMALRPDLTLPVALAEIDLRKRTGLKGVNVHRYAARAFRQPAVPSEPMEFDQVGFERFGAASGPEIDAESYALVSEVSFGAGAIHGIARFGDLSLVPVFIDALELPSDVNAGLRRAFRQEGGVRAFLDRISRPADSFVATLIGHDRKTVEQMVASEMKRLDISHFADRTANEVVTRLIEQARDYASGAVPDIARDTLGAVLELSCTPMDAAAELRAIAASAGVLAGVEVHLDALERRSTLISRLAPQYLDGADFSPSFGRRFTYYDGFVFEIAEAGERQLRPFGAGGRYDNLLSDLSQGDVAATAIGGVVRPDRLNLAASVELDG